MKMIKFIDRYTEVSVAQVIDNADGTNLREVHQLPAIRIDSTRVTPKKALLEAIKVYHDFDNIIVTDIERCEDVYEMTSDEFMRVAWRNRPPQTDYID